MHFLYPSDPLKTREPDEFYAEEMVAAQRAGFTASVFSLEELQAGVRKVHPAIPASAEVIHRGWMLSTEDYSGLLEMITGFGSHPFTNLTAYLCAHHLPNWYPLLADLTPETRIFSLEQNLEQKLRELDWSEYFIKDYVKSLKTSVGSRIAKPEQLSAVLKEMRRFRGTIEGGICVRKIERFIPGAEKRYFVINARAFAAEGEPPTIVEECARRIKSRFFSVDVTEREDGQLRVVEIGDGQVSDLIGWTIERFVEACRASFA